MFEPVTGSGEGFEAFLESLWPYCCHAYDVNDNFDRLVEARTDFAIEPAPASSWRNFDPTNWEFTLKRASSSTMASHLRPRTSRHPSIWRQALRTLRSFALEIGYPT